MTFSSCGACYCCRMMIDDSAHRQTLGASMRTCAAMSGSSSASLAQSSIAGRCSAAFAGYDTALPLIVARASGLLGVAGRPSYGAALVVQVLARSISLSPHYSRAFRLSGHLSSDVPAGVAEVSRRP